MSSAMVAWWAAGAKSFGDGLCWSYCGSALEAIYLLFFRWSLGAGNGDDILAVNRDDILAFKLMK